MKKSILPGCVIALFLMMGLIGCGSENRRKWGPRLNSERLGEQVI
jgi:hypothetical protein